MFEDECHFQRCTTIIRSWYPKGSAPEIPSPAVKEKVSIMGAVSTTGRLITMEASIFNADSFKGFVQKILRESPRSKKIILVLDNARFHHARANREYLKSVKERIELMFLPPYSPELNPIELFWKTTRRHVTHNRFFDSMDVLRDALLTFFRKSKKENLALAKLSAFY
jgi:transposase